MYYGLIALACVFASTAAAQVGGYLGPGVLSRGAGDIGTVNGEQVDLRVYADVNAVYDNGLVPFALDPKGNLVEVNGLYGVQADLGVYGRHRWRTALLGLDYHGNLYHYTNASNYDGSTHNLTLGYTYQMSKHLSIDLRQLAGTSSIGFGGPGFYGNTVIAPDAVNQPTAFLFDNRTYYIQSTMDVNYIASARTTFTAGGDGYTVRRSGNGLANVNGYTLRGSIQHRLSRTNTIGATYQHIHYDFSPSFGQSDIDAGEAFFDTQLNRRWTFGISGGLFGAAVEGVEQVTLAPEVAALLGQPFGIRAFSRTNLYPSGHAQLGGRFKTSSVTLSYTQSVAPGNGVYLTSRSNSALAAYSYTGVSKLNLGISGGYNTLKSVGQGIQPYTQLTAGAGLTYGLTKMLHVVARYDARRQEIDLYGYRRTGYRATLGLAFSPGDIPLSLW